MFIFGAYPLPIKKLDDTYKGTWLARGNLIEFERTLLAQRHLARSEGTWQARGYVAESEGS